MMLFFNHATVSDYTPQNNNYNTNSPSTRASTTSYRGAVRDETPKRGNVVYNNVNQDIYQQSSTVPEYNDQSYQVVTTQIYCKLK